MGREFFNSHACLQQLTLASGLLVMQHLRAGDTRNRVDHVPQADFRAPKKSCEQVRSFPPEPAREFAAQSSQGNNRVKS
jgi:hypothetical protein